MASALGATAFQKGLGVAHSMAHALSPLAGLHHGLANAVVLPYVARFNAEHVGDAYERVCRRIGLEAGTLPTWLDNLRDQLDLPRNLSEAGVDPVLLDPLSQKAFADTCHQTNPRSCALDDLRALFSAAFGS